MPGRRPLSHISSHVHTAHITYQIISCAHPPVLLRASHLLCAAQTLPLLWQCHGCAPKLTAQPKRAATKAESTQAAHADTAALCTRMARTSRQHAACLGQHLSSPRRLLHSVTRRLAAESLTGFSIFAPAIARERTPSRQCMGVHASAFMHACEHSCTTPRAVTVCRASATRWCCPRMLRTQA